MGFAACRRDERGVAGVGMELRLRKYVSVLLDCNAEGRKSEISERWVVGGKCRVTGANGEGR